MSSEHLGRVVKVDLNTIEIAVSKNAEPSFQGSDGNEYRVGQLGSMVKIVINQDLVIIGLISSVIGSPDDSITTLGETNYSSEILEVQLLGEISKRSGFTKGIGTYPTINDEVQLALEADLKTIYGEEAEGLIPIGCHSSTDSLSIFLNLKNLILRHSAILGSTGSGKSNTTAHILKNILNAYPGSRIVLVDPHGEYASAFKDKARVFRINDQINPLYIPFWTMTFDELSFFLVGRQEGQERPEDKRFRDEILSLKKDYVSKLRAGSITEEQLSADSPIPFDIRQMWYNFNREVNATHREAHRESQTKETECLLKEGDPSQLIEAKFEPYEMGSLPPYKSKNETMYSYEKKIYSRLKDSNYDFMFNPGEYFDKDSSIDLDELIRSWIDNEERLSILDLSGIPFELTDISVGLITRIIFDTMYWGKSEDYTGRNRPLLMVYEEAHSYLPRNPSSSHIYGYARKAVEKIFKEGRKFGIGASVVTQRPSEVSETILTQAGTFVALRLTNSGDKNSVKSAAPHNMTGLMDLLPSLRIGEAVIVGEAITIPSRVRVPLVEPRPSSDDPDLINSWKKNFKSKKNKYKNIVKSMRTKKTKN